MVGFKHNKNPKMRVARLENTNPAFKFFIADGVKLVNIDAQNIVDRDLKLVLGLLWTLILKYQISRNKADALKKALLEWVNSKVVEHKVKNFSSDRNDGNTLCELISKLEPDFIDMNEANGKPAGDQRIEYAENIAEKVDIPSIIDPKDMAVDEPDELSVMAYVSFYRHYETEKLRALSEEVRRRLEEMLRTPDPTKCTMSVPGLDTGDVFLPQTFTIQTKNAKSDDITERCAPFHVYITLTDKPKPMKEDQGDDSSHHGIQWFRCN